MAASRRGRTEVRHRHGVAHRRALLRRGNGDQAARYMEYSSEAWRVGKS